VFFRDRDKKNTEYQLFPDLRERIMPGAFDRALAEGQDVFASYNHNRDALLGRTPDTLSLSVDSKGLRYEIPIDDTDPDHQRILPKLTRGDLRGSSFSFQIRQQRFEQQKGGGEIREIQDVDLVEVGPVTDPAYKGTTAGVRDASDAAEAEAARKAWREGEAEKAAQQAKKLKEMDMTIRVAETA